MGKAGKLGILIVEDDPSVRRLLGRALARAGHKVFAAANGQEALRLAQAHRPSLALVDIHLPKGINGFTLCRRLRDERGMDVFITTGVMIEDSDRWKAYQAGAIRYFVKPINMKELLGDIELYRNGPQPLGPVTPTRSIKVLVVDDDERFLSAVGVHLEDTPYVPYAARLGYRAVMAAHKLKPALILLDVSLPDIGGAEIIRLLKAHPNTRNIPILVWTKSRKQGQEFICLEEGAEDYLVRGVHEVSSLPIRISRLLGPVSIARSRMLERGPVAMDTAARNVSVYGKPTEIFTPREFRLLAYLLERSPQVVSWDDLERDLWGVLPEYLTHSYALESIEVHLRRLRAKLGRAACCLITRKGLGVQFEPTLGPGPVLS